jgi:8-amino-7-oxononanoate synthase
MLDFTSALYLGLRHPSWSLRPWSQFTTGVPAVLTSPPDARLVAQQLAELQGCEGWSLGTSTLHLFWDLFGILAQRRVAIYLDAGTYPIARWGVERAAGRGVPVQEFAHHDAEALSWYLRKNVHKGLPPLVVADGFCPACGGLAPIIEYLEIVRSAGGTLLLDDTQALGIFGYSPSRDAPYGHGGGGSLRRAGASGPDVLLVSSMAKGLGVPAAVLSGSKTMVAQFEANSETRVHCSPPSVATLRAAEHALALNGQVGESLRLRLAQLVARFRARMAEIGLYFHGGFFPVQTLAPTVGLDAASLNQRLLRAGIRTVLHRARTGQGARISFLITARHEATDFDRVVEVLTDGGRAGIQLFQEGKTMRHDSEPVLSAEVYRGLAAGRTMRPAVTPIRASGMLQTTAVPQRSKLQQASAMQASDTGCLMDVDEVIRGWGQYQTFLQTNSAQLPRQERDKITTLADLVVTSFAKPGCSPLGQITIVGHADHDARGPEFEKKISSERATSVAVALAKAIMDLWKVRRMPPFQKGAVAFLPRPKGVGATRPDPFNVPVVKNRELNRRVEIGIRPRGAPVPPPDTCEARVTRFLKLLGTRLVDPDPTGKRTVRARCILRKICRQGVLDLFVNGLASNETIGGRFIGEKLVSWTGNYDPPPLSRADFLKFLGTVSSILKGPGFAPRQSDDQILKGLSQLILMINEGIVGVERYITLNSSDFGYTGDRTRGTRLSSIFADHLEDENSIYSCYKDFHGGE